MATTGPEVMKATRPRRTVADVLGVVPLGEGAVDAQRLHAAQHETAPLEPRDDLADETAGDAVGLDHDERAFHVVPLCAAARRGAAQLSAL
jgi:hypothetical protein